MTTRFGKELLRVLKLVKRLAAGLGDKPAAFIVAQPERLCRGDRAVQQAIPYFLRLGMPSVLLRQFLLKTLQDGIGRHAFGVRQQNLKCFSHQFTGAFSSITKHSLDFSSVALV